MDPRLKKCATRISQLREEMGWSKEQLADKMGCPPSLITYYESGKRAPGYYNILKMKELFNETADYIMGESDIRLLKKDAQ